jgi:hypothetical protein
MCSERKPSNPARNFDALDHVRFVHAFDTENRDRNPAKGIMSMVGGAVSIFAILAVTACGEISPYPEFESVPTPSTHESAPPPSTEPLTPLPPRPQWAAVGQPIEFADTFDMRGTSFDTLPRITMTVTSAQTTNTDPHIPAEFRKAKAGEQYLILTVKTNSPNPTHVPSRAHFQLVAPDGATFELNENVAYRPDRYENGNGVLSCNVPATGIPKGTKVQLELYRGQPFGWVVS